MFFFKAYLNSEPHPVSPLCHQSIMDTDNLITALPLAGFFAMLIAYCLDSLRPSGSLADAPDAEPGGVDLKIAPTQMDLHALDVHEIADKLRRPGDHLVGCTFPKWLAVSDSLHGNQVEAIVAGRRACKVRDEGRLQALMMDAFSAIGRPTDEATAKDSTRRFLAGPIAFFSKPGVEGIVFAIVLAACGQEFGVIFPLLEKRAAEAETPKEKKARDARNRSKIVPIPVRKAAAWSLLYDNVDDYYELQRKNGLWDVANVDKEGAKVQLQDMV